VSQTIFLKLIDRRARYFALHPDYQPAEHGIYQLESLLFSVKNYLQPCVSVWRG